jgi:hypothetical protein
MPPQDEISFELTYYTCVGETYYHVGPFSTEEAALEYVNRAHRELRGVGSVSISLLNPPTIEPRYVRSFESGPVRFEDAALDEEYHFVTA